MRKNTFSKVQKNFCAKVGLFVHVQMWVVQKNTYPYNPIFHWDKMINFNMFSILILILIKVKSIFKLYDTYI